MEESKKEKLKDKMREKLLEIILRMVPASEVIEELKLLSKEQKPIPKSLRDKVSAYNERIIIEFCDWLIEELEL